MSENRVDEVTGTETTGHSWDGIEELNTPLPRWWLWTFYATILWGLVYVILYPAWPLVSSATTGVLGWSARANVAADIATVDAAQADRWSAIAETDLVEVAADPDLGPFATRAGAALFRNNCSQCHGSGAAGAIGYPNLLDDAWLWGGTLDEIEFTIRHGIRNEEDLDARWSEMPAFGEILEEADITTLVAHVQSFPSGTDPLAGDAGALYADNCASCHGDDGLGERSIGAPNLTDAIWLFGDDTDRLTKTITEGPFGVMPPWLGRLDEAEVRALAVYVHGLGGGE